MSSSLSRSRLLALLDGCSRSAAARASTSASTRSRSASASADEVVEAQLRVAARSAARIDASPRDGAQ